jgi:hypothetical protein
MSNSRSPARVVHGGNRHRQVAMIEFATVNHAVRRSKIAFWVVGSIVAVTTAVVASAITNLYRAIGLGVWAGIVCGFFVGLALFVWPAVRVLWHWATELITLAAFLSSYGLLTAAVPWWLAPTVLGVGVATPMLFAQSRRLLVGWVWCLVSRHRLRVCFASFVAAKRTGMTPLILGARPTPAGERVWIWLRPGLALGDREPQLDKLAAGCWAAECRLTPASRRYSALLRLDIARRNPLTGQVGSPPRPRPCRRWRGTGDG